MGALSGREMSRSDGCEATESHQGGATLKGDEERRSSLQNGLILPRVSEGFWLRGKAGLRTKLCRHVFWAILERWMVQTSTGTEMTKQSFCLEID